MKVVQFVNNLDMGGLERLAVELAYRQKAVGHEPVIYCLTHRGFLPMKRKHAESVLSRLKSPPAHLWRRSGKSSRR